MDPLDLLRLRTRRLSDGRNVVSKGRDYVLCWLQQALRGEHNPIIDAAVAIGNERGLPVVVLHTLENRYPYASHRIHRFMLEASRELGPDVEARGLRFVRWVRRHDADPSTVEVAGRLAERAAAVVVDDVPLFVTPEYAAGLVEAVPRAVFAVDACCAVPMNAIDRQLGGTPVTAARAFRAAHTPLREELALPDLTQAPSHSRFDGDLDPGADADGAPLAWTDLPDDDAALDALIATCNVDMTVPPAPGFRGGRSHALARLEHAVGAVVPRYKWTRNNPALPASTARLSPWMHFGVLSPVEVARAVYRAEREDGLHAAARWKFLDETLTWREVSYHRARHEPDFARWRGLPAAPRRSLEKHAADPRPALLSLDELARGESPDPAWNAAQKQYTLDGWMHNNLRMFWVKQILRWRQDPREAWAAACVLNDRFSLDGRDPATYGGIRWGFGEAKKGSSEKPIFGWVAPKNAGALRRRDGVPEWIDEQAARPVEPAPAPLDEAEAFSAYL